MRISRVTLILIVMIIMLSVFVANFLTTISTESEDGLSHHHLQQFSKPPVIDDSYSDLMWFSQVSDLHLSIFHDNNRAEELLHFCDSTMKHINPSVILATGDLTDSKTKDFMGSAQYKAEWVKYKNVLDKCTTLRTIPWLDIRGNHDNFDVPSISSDRNYFRNYSMQGMKHSRSYAHKISVGSKTYTFIGVDACPAVGVKRPFNFIGLLPASEIEDLKKLARVASDSDHIIWFGHYPTSCILSRPPGIRAIFESSQKSLAYLCGHFHTMLGLVPNMYTIQKGGYYELELADWKDNRMYRVMAIDHGLLSFIDVRHGSWPVILVTNPKDALFQAPSREPLEAMKTSTHIRVLVFSNSNIESVRIKINDGDWQKAHCVKGPLYVLLWDPALFSVGIHHIYVEVKDGIGRDKVIDHPFSLDGSRLQFKMLPRTLLMMSFSSMMQIFYGLSVFSCVFPLCFFRFMNKKALESSTPLPALRNNFVHRWMKRMWILSNIDILFYPIILYPLYLSVGPWAIAEVLDGQYGVIFIWGIFTNGVYIPSTSTYGYAFIQLFFLHGPLMNYSAYLVEKRLHPSSSIGPRSMVKVMKRLFSNIPFFIFLSSQIVLAYTFYLAYGIYSIVGPVRMWPLALVVWLWYHTRTMPAHQVMGALKAWECHECVATG